MIGQDWFRFIPKALRDEVEELFRDVISGRIEPYRNIESRVLTAAGVERRIVWNNALVRDDDGAVIGTLSSGEDVTERRAAESAPHWPVACAARVRSHSRRGYLRG